MANRQIYKEEATHPWLTILLDGYAMCDEAVKKDVIRQEVRRKQKLACHRGCHGCCLNPNIPISPLELRGISWYVSEILDEFTQDRLIPRLQNHSSVTECPCLLDKCCSIYPVRPIACRTHYVFGPVCKPLEDITKTRSNETFSQDCVFAKKVVMRFLDPDMVALESLKQKKKAFETGSMTQISRPMHNSNWTFINSAMALTRQRRLTKDASAMT